ncbi:MAG: hypothetical protein KJZ93_16990 [Caldilineaceae bacterium]|nr:hypothetical protein [Caldilineaceae bacterium]
MKTIAAVLSGAETADEAIKRLSELNVDDLDWRVYRPEVDHERIMPGVPPAGLAGGGATQQAGIALRADLPEDIPLEDAGIPESEAEFYAMSLARGGTVVVVSAPSEHENAIYELLEEAGASRITSE